MGDCRPQPQIGTAGMPRNVETDNLLTLGQYYRSRPVVFFLDGHFANVCALSWLQAIWDTLPEKEPRVRQGAPRTLHRFMPCTQQIVIMGTRWNFQRWSSNYIVFVLWPRAFAVELTEICLSLQSIQEGFVTFAPQNITVNYGVRPGSSGPVQIPISSG